MKLIINGDEQEVKDGATVMSMLEGLEIDPGRVAVELNMVIIKKCDYSVSELKEGDQVEIVNFVGGG
ncbi:sulfur carrier protein ThiS [bacterium]|nr:sulfur carrier protein ThiS [bacterium]